MEVTKLVQFVKAHNTGKPPFDVLEYPQPEARVKVPLELPKPLEKPEADFMEVVLIAVTPLVAETVLPMPPIVLESDGFLVLFQ